MCTWHPHTALPQDQDSGHAPKPMLLYLCMEVRHHTYHRFYQHLNHKIGLHGSLHVTYMIYHVSRPGPVMRRLWKPYTSARSRTTLSRSCWMLVPSTCVWVSMSQWSIIDVNSCMCITDVHLSPLNCITTWPRRQDMHRTLCSFIYMWRFDILHTIDSINATNTNSRYSIPLPSSRHTHAYSYSFIF